MIKQSIFLELEAKEFIGKHYSAKTAMKKIKKIFWWVMFSVFVAPTLIGGISDLTADIGCKKFGSGVIGTSNDDDFFKSLSFEPSLWTQMNPIEGWDAPPEWLEEWLEAKK